jgi:hypothetical protein
MTSDLLRFVCGNPDPVSALKVRRQLTTLLMADAKIRRAARLTEGLLSE